MNPADPNSQDTRAVVVSGLNHYFGSGESAKQVLSDVHLTIHRGEIVIMTGPSGSGKTTLLTLIGALRSVQEGSIRFFGTELRGLDPAHQRDIRRNIGFIFQAHNLFDSLTARQNVYLAAELSGLDTREKARRTDEILTRLGLGERMDYKPARLSGGQRQRVAIARALVNAPPIVLADEPTAALDRDSGRNVLELLQTLAREQGCAIIIVTHDNRIIDAADRIVNLTDGTITSDTDVKRTLYICGFIRECAVFRSMSPNDLADVAQSMDAQRFPAGEPIIRQGETGDRFYLIHRGAVEVLVERDGAVQKVAQLGSGDFFGEAALLRNEPRNATVRAVESVDAFTLSKDDFLAAVRNHKSFQEQMANTLFTR